MPLFKPAFIAAVLVALSGSLEAQPTSPSPCSSPESRQFDFWIGEWVVTARGNPAGESRITRILDGCVILEEWTGRRGLIGKSFDFFDASLGKWRQVWVDNKGNSLFLTGGIQGGSMVLEGSSVNQGQQVLNRITWTPNDSTHTVLQTWETSKDEGSTWTTLFSGLYSKKQ